MSSRYERHDGFHCRRRETQQRRKRTVADVVDFHRVIVVARHQFYRQPFHHAGHDIGHLVIERQDRALDVQYAADIADQLLQRISSRTAQFQIRIVSGREIQALDHGTRDIVHENRLKTCRRAGQHHGGKGASQPRKQIQKPVVRPEDHRGAKNSRAYAARLCDANLLLPAGFGAQIFTGGIVRGFQCRYVQQAAHAVLAARIDYFPRQFGMHACEFARAAFMQDARQADNGVAAREQARERGRIVHVGIDDIHGRQHDQGFGAFAPPRGHAHAQPPGDELMHDLPANETGAADDANRTDFHICALGPGWRRSSAGHEVIRCPSLSCFAALWPAQCPGARAGSDPVDETSACKRACCS